MIRWVAILIATLLLGCDGGGRVDVGQERDRQEPRKSSSATEADASESPATVKQAPPVKAVRQTDGAATSKLIAERPYALGVPLGLDESTPAPLFIYLHGYGATSTGLRRILHIATFARSKGYIWVTPDGTTAPSGRRFWNATPACCNFAGSTVDDVAYISAIIDDARANARIDDGRIYIVGFSNGGFMAHRLACELGDRIAGIVSIAGATFEREERCRPTSPVAVLQIHGDADDIVPYEGGYPLGNPEIPHHPSAKTTIARWAAHNGCDPAPTQGEPIDIEERIPGAETRVTRHENCRPGGAAELWTVRGGSHFVAQNAAGASAIYEFLMAHRRPGSANRAPPSSNPR